MRYPYSKATLPSFPNLFSLLICSKYVLYRKYEERWKQFYRHYKALFIKQVFPKFLSPTRPLLESFFQLKYLSESNFSSNAYSQWS